MTAPVFSPADIIRDAAWAALYQMHDVAALLEGAACVRNRGNSRMLVCIARDKADAAGADQLSKLLRAVLADTDTVNDDLLSQAQAGTEQVIARLDEAYLAA